MASASVRDLPRARCDYHHHCRCRHHLDKQAATEAQEDLIVRVTCAPVTAGCAGGSGGSRNGSGVGLGCGGGVLISVRPTTVAVALLPLPSMLDSPADRQDRPRPTARRPDKMPSTVSRRAGTHTQAMFLLFVCSEGEPVRERRAVREDALPPSTSMGQDYLPISRNVMRRRALLFRRRRITSERDCSRERGKGDELDHDVFAEQ